LLDGTEEFSVTPRKSEDASSERRVGWMNVIKVTVGITPHINPGVSFLRVTAIGASWGGRFRDAHPLNASASCPARTSEIPTSRVSLRPLVGRSEMGVPDDCAELVTFGVGHDVPLADLFDDVLDYRCSEFP